MIGIGFVTITKSLARIYNVFALFRRPSLINERTEIIFKKLKYLFEEQIADGWINPFVIGNSNYTYNRRNVSLQTIFRV
jgi:hypothetical protein